MSMAAVIDFNLALEIVVGSLLLLAGAVFYSRVIKPRRKSLLTSTLLPSCGKYGKKVIFMGKSNDPIVSPHGFEAHIVKIDSRGGGKYDVEMEHFLTKEVKLFPGLVWHRCFKNLSEGTPEDGVNQGILATRVDWDNGYFDWNDTLIDSYREEVDFISKERAEFEVKKKIADLFEYRNTHTSPETAQLNSPRPPEQL